MGDIQAVHYVFFGINLAGLALSLLAFVLKTSAFNAVCLSGNLLIAGYWIGRIFA